MITASLVKELRERGIAKAAKKSDRIAAEGLVYCYVTDDKKVGVVLEVNAETDFVAKNERIAILEAKKLNIPIIGLVDTNCNPEDVDYPIPGNDDAIRAVKLITDVMANAIIEGRQGEILEAESEMSEEAEVATEEPKDIEEVVAEETAETVAE